jgi:AhpD family alkylhydroperoxidase
VRRGPRHITPRSEEPALRAYSQLSKILEGGTLGAAERQVVLLTASVVNRCRYCVAAHSVLAARAGAPEQVVSAIRDERPVPDARLGALSTLTRRLVESRGWLGEDEVASFVGAGFDPAQLIEVITAVAMKTLSNYTNHLAETPLDPQFRSGCVDASGCRFWPSRSAARVRSAREARSAGADPGSGAAPAHAGKGRGRRGVSRRHRPGLMVRGAVDGAAASHTGGCSGAAKPQEREVPEAMQKQE